jgi:hypothetical protein
MNARLQAIEGDADKLELQLLRELYHGDYSAKHVIFLRDLYELLEKVIDRCRDAGNVILQVVLKYASSIFRDDHIFRRRLCRHCFRIQQRLSRCG